MLPTATLPWLPLAAIVGVVLAELVARLRARTLDRYHVRTPGSRTLAILDREAFPSLPTVVRTEINADGERGDPPPQDWTRAWRVLVAGGSAAECRLVDQPSTWPAVAQRFLNRRANLGLLRTRRVHVGNVGRSSATCRRVERMFESLLPRRERLDAIVLAVGTADVADWLARGAPDRIEREVPPSEVFAEHPGSRFEWTPRGSALGRALAAWRRRRFEPVEVREETGVLDAPDRTAIGIVGETPDPAPLLERFEQDLRRLLARSRARARTVIVVRPSWSEAPPAVRSLLERIDRLAAEIAREAGVAELDPKLLLEPGAAHFHDETNLTPAGCRILGEAVAQAILRERAGHWASRARTTREERHSDVA